MTSYQAATPKAKGVGNPYGAPRLSVYGILIEQSVAQYKPNAAVHSLGVELFGEQMLKTILTGLQGALDHCKTKGDLAHFAIFGNYVMSRTTKDGRQITARSFTEGRVLHAEAKAFGLMGCHKVKLLDAILLPWLEFSTEGRAPKDPIERATKKLSKVEESEMEEDSGKI